MRRLLLTCGLGLRPGRARQAVWTCSVLVLQSPHPPLQCWLLGILCRAKSFILCISGGAQVAVSPPAFSCLFLLILKGPLPGQAIWKGDKNVPEARSPISALQYPGVDMATALHTRICQSDTSGLGDGRRIAIRVPLSELAKIKVITPGVKQKLYNMDSSVQLASCTASHSDAQLPLSTAGISQGRMENRSRNTNRIT